jgi:Zn-dependent protease
MIYSQSVLLELTLWIIPVVTAVTWREAAKAWVCHMLGDSHAKRSGFITLNPLSHLDPIGSLLIPFLLILRHQPAVAWAKRYNVHATFLKHGHISVIIVVLAGLLSNFFMACGWHIVLNFSQSLTSYPITEEVIRHLALDGIYINAALLLMHIIPIAPMDMSLIVSQSLPRFLKSMYNITASFGHYAIALVVFTGLYTPSIQAILQFLANHTSKFIP